VAYVVAAIVGLLFGAVDQYLGTIRFGPWAWTVSGMSAPWLVLPLAVGMTQDRDRRAAALGLVVTLSALVGYFAMTYSPMESVPIDQFLPGFVRIATTGYNPLWILGGIVTGPLFGFLGHRWRVARSWVSAALVAGALCLEPLARAVTGRLSPQPFVWGVEVALGAIVAAASCSVIVQARRTREAVPSTPQN
jgi:uncharacterized membrane protein (UPF0136 family)